jgi:hypothetical protein
MAMPVKPADSDVLSSAEVRRIKEEYLESQVRLLTAIERLSDGPTLIENIKKLRTALELPAIARSSGGSKESRKTRRINKVRRRVY